MTERRARLILVALFSALLLIVALERIEWILAVGAVPLAKLLRTSQGRGALKRRLGFLVPLALGTFLAIGLSGASLTLAVRPSMRMLAALLWATLLGQTLSAREIERGLRSLRVPGLLVDLLVQTRRFGTQLLSTLNEAWAAAALRGGQRSARTTLHSAGAVAGVVLTRALDRSESVAIAAALRGSGLSGRDLGSRDLGSRGFKGAP
jgi:energy-coupling factor transporter transmembrane protein EcfT